MDIRSKNHLFIQDTYSEKLPFGVLHIDFWGKNETSQNTLLQKEEEFHLSHVILKKYYSSYLFKFMNQVHTKNIINTDDTNVVCTDISWGECDAVFSRNNNIALAVRVADCIPIFFWSNKNQIFGVIHAGWRGLQQGIVTELYNKIISNKVTSSELCFWIGPHIGNQSYEVGKDVYDFFPLECSNKISENKRNLDLQSILELEFKSIGINPDNIIWNCTDTFKNSSLYYSHRKGDIGRNIGVIYLKQEKL